MIARGRFAPAPAGAVERGRQERMPGASAPRGRCRQQAPAAGSSTTSSSSIGPVSCANSSRGWRWNAVRPWLEQRCGVPWRAPAAVPTAAAGTAELVAVAAAATAAAGGSGSSGSSSGPGSSRSRSWSSSSSSSNSSSRRSSVWSNGFEPQPPCHQRMNQLGSRRPSAPTWRRRIPPLPPCAPQACRSRTSERLAAGCIGRLSVAWRR